MPVRIIRRGATEVKKPEVAPSLPAAVEVETVEAAPSKVTVGAALPHPRGYELAGCIILAKQDLEPEQGHVKFLVHRIRHGIYYRIRGVDIEERRIALTAQTTMEFTAKIDHTLQTNYVVVLAPQDLPAPPPEVISFVAHKLPVAPLVQSSAT